MHIEFYAERENKREGDREKQTREQAKNSGKSRRAQKPSVDESLQLCRPCCKATAPKTNNTSLFPRGRKFLGNGPGFYVSGEIPQTQTAPPRLLTWPVAMPKSVTPRGYPGASMSSSVQSMFRLICSFYPPSPTLPYHITPIHSTRQRWQRALCPPYANPRHPTQLAEGSLTYSRSLLVIHVILEVHQLFSVAHGYTPLRTDLETLCP